MTLIGPKQRKGEQKTREDDEPKRNAVDTEVPRRTERPNPLMIGHELEARITPLEGKHQPTSQCPGGCGEDQTDRYDEFVHSR